MSSEFKLPDPGEGIHEAEVVDVLVSEGEHVDDGQPILVVETDKATNDIPSPHAGTIAEVRVSEGETIRVGDVVVTFEEGEGDEEAGETESKKGEEGEEREKPSAEDREKDDREEKDEAPEKKKRERKESAEREKAKKEGRKKREDDEKAREAEEARGKKEASREQAKEGREGAAERKKEKKAESAREKRELPHPRGRPVPASPATRRLAREQGVDLHLVPGSGRRGRVTDEDLRAFLEEQGKGEEPERHEARETREEKGERREEPAEKKKDEAPSDVAERAERFGPIEREPLRSVRRVIARRMAESWRRVPHVTHQDQADITELEEFRRRRAPAIEEEGGSLTITAFALKALVGALREHPRFNASLDEDNEELIYRRYVHIGVATDSERGLLVPVVRDVDRKSLRQLAVELPELTERAREGELSREDMDGGSFTLTNVGPLGGTGFTPIINWPQVAILGLGRAELRPRFEGSASRWDMRPRLMLPLALAFDHRVVDGADAARFVNHVKRALASPEALLLDI